MKLAKMMMVGLMLLVPTMAMGIAQDPAGQQLQQQAAAMPAGEHDHTGEIVEVRDDSFSLRGDDGSVVWFMITPELKQSYSAELVSGNRVTVWGTAGDTADQMNATRIERAEGSATADLDTDFDVDIEADEGTATAKLETETEIEDSDTQIAENEFDTDEDQYDADSDELPSTASSLPAIGSLGLLALLGAAVVAFARRF